MQHLLLPVPVSFIKIESLLPDTPVIRYQPFIISPKSSSFSTSSRWKIEYVPNELTPQKRSGSLLKNHPLSKDSTFIAADFITTAPLNSSNMPHLTFHLFSLVSVFNHILNSCSIGSLLNKDSFSINGNISNAPKVNK